MTILLPFLGFANVSLHQADQEPQQASKLYGIIARSDRGTYKPHMDYLIENHGFKDMYLRDKRNKRIKSSAEMLSDIFIYTVYILRNFKTFRKADVIVSAGWTSIVLKGLIKLRIIKCKQFYWLGFFLHNLKVFPFIKLLLQATAIKNETFIVHAKFDAELYQKKLNIKSSKIKVLPYGDWKEIAIDAPATNNATEDYYFAGGYTDRDYKSLIQAFKKIDKKLIIVGSHLNNDLNVEVPDNIVIKKDIDKKSFHELVKNAKVCILPMKQATGASGHMVLLNYMKEGKAIIATNVPGIRDYVDPNQSAILMDNLVTELPGVINKLEADPDLVYRLRMGAIKYYNENFSKESLSRQFGEIVLAN